MTRLLTPVELADYLQVTEATLADFRYKGKGPNFLKVGRLVRYKREDVEEWLAASSDERFAPTAQKAGRPSTGSRRRSRSSDPLAFRGSTSGAGLAGRSRPSDEGVRDGE